MKRRWRLLFPAKAKPDRFVEPEGPPGAQAQGRDPAAVGRVSHGEWAYRYSRFCGRYRRARQKRSLRQQHRAGEKASTTEPTSIATPARSVMPRSLSGCSGPPATPTRGIAHCPTGSPPISACCASSVAWVPDNLKAAVTRLPLCTEDQRHLYRPHYGPARPYKPRDKAKAEVRCRWPGCASQVLLPGS